MKHNVFLIIEKSKTKILWKNNNFYENLNFEHLIFLFIMIFKTRTKNKPNNTLPSFRSMRKNKNMWFQLIQQFLSLCIPIEH